jgi:flagellar basal body-associated protein FliL
MNEQRDEQRLEELITRSINTDRPQFDAEKWKQTYPEEYQALLFRAAKGDSVKQPKILKVILKSPLTKIAAAAVIILALSIFSTRQASDDQEQARMVEAEKSPVEMMTEISLERAFRRGGIEAVEKQCKQAFEPISPRPESSSIKQILAEFNGNGKSSERTRP